MNGIAALAVLVLVCGLGCGGDTSHDRDRDLVPSGGSGGQVEVTGGSGGGNVGNPDASTPIAPCLQRVPTQDIDGDGYTVAEGDCNDCNPAIHPDAEEILDNGADEDCDSFDTVVVSDGGTTAVAQHCDEGLLLASTDAMDGARAIGLCEGVTTAAYTNAIGEPGLDSPLQTGLVDRFGVLQPREGQRMLLLSTGVARAPGQPDYTPDCDVFPLTDVIADPPPSPAPPGHPRPTPASVCGDNIVHDTVIVNVAALSLTLRAPEDAHALSIDFNFYSAEYPHAVCYLTNDAFVILMDPPPAGADHGNIAFDSEGNSINVNSGLMRVCAPPDPVLNVPRDFDCPLGTDELEGTGYGDADEVSACSSTLEGSGATGWLTTSVPVTGGAVFTLRFAIWDAGGASQDSSVLVDNLRWTRDADDVTTEVEVPITKPAGPS